MIPMNFSLSSSVNLNAFLFLGVDVGCKWVTSSFLLTVEEVEDLANSSFLLPVEEVERGSKSELGRDVGKGDNDGLTEAVFTTGGGLDEEAVFTKGTLLDIASPFR